MNRKAITALINGSLYIDPSDATEEKVKEIKSRLFKTYGINVPVVIAPIKEWMPQSGTKALIKEAINEAKGIKSNVSKKEFKRILKK